MGENVFYRRVSSAQQSLGRQVPPEGVETHRVFEEKVSGSSKDRPALQEMIRYVRAGDHVYVSSIDRLARNLQDLQSLVETITKKDTSITFMKENLTFSPEAAADPFKNLLFVVLAAFADFERSMIRQRQQEGIERAKAEGKYTGRKPHLNYELVRALLNYGRLPREIADWLDIGIASVYRIKKQTKPKPIDGWSLTNNEEAFDWQSGPLAGWTPSDLIGFITDVQDRLLNGLGDDTPTAVIRELLDNAEADGEPYSKDEEKALMLIGTMMEVSPVVIEQELERLRELDREAMALIWTKADPDGVVDRRRMAFLKGEGQTSDEVAKTTGVDVDVIEAIWADLAL